MFLQIFLLYIALPAFLISLIANRLFGGWAAAYVFITLVFAGYVFLAYCVAYLVGYGHGDTAAGNWIMALLVGPFALWLGGKAYNNVMSLLWQRKEKEEEAKMAAAESAKPQYPNTRAPEPY